MPVKAKRAQGGTAMTTQLSALALTATPINGKEYPKIPTAEEGEGSKRKREKEAIVDEDEESAVSAIDSVVYEDESDLDEVYESDTDSRAGGKKDVTFTSTSTTALPQGQDLLDIMSRQSRSGVSTHECFRGAKAHKIFYLFFGTVDYRIVFASSR
jgi:hypothetical protein